MIVGSLAGVAVLYELVSLAHGDQLEAQLHSPSALWTGAACMFVFGMGLAMVAPRVARGFASFTAVGALAAASVAASGTEAAYAGPLACVGTAAALVVAASFRRSRWRNRARMT